ncbi:hypothetical protein [Carbonactinospora thermoautotrophica]|uniref:hypothetical protein n=1 Tax=Carbonactinospora thermoautotrophica TaxID=1469144 RepID=UPI000A6D7C4A|nr:hypothetical protein [Carbonactinospora thermoautotrophica]
MSDLPPAPGAVAVAQALLDTVPPGTLVTGRLAAWLYGVLEPGTRDQMPLDVATRLGNGPHVRRSGVRASRRRLDEDDVVTCHGLLVTSPLRTCFDLIRSSGLVEGVAVADAFLHAGFFTQLQLVKYVGAHPGWRNVRRARQVALLAHPDAESPGETALRLVLVLAGLPEPCVNAPLFDERGRYLGRPDLLYLDPVFGIEYDGAYHDDEDVRRIDVLREQRFRDTGIPLLRYTAEDLQRRQHVIVDVVRSALRGDPTLLEEAAWPLARRVCFARSTLDAARETAARHQGRGQGAVDVASVRS